MEYNKCIVCSSEVKLDRDNVCENPKCQGAFERIRDKVVKSIKDKKELERLTAIDLFLKSIDKDFKISMEQGKRIIDGGID